MLTLTTVANWDTALSIVLDGEEIAFNNDGGGLPNYNSSLSATLPAGGVYDIVVRSFRNNSGGEYTLIIESEDAATVTPTASQSATATPS